MTSHRDRPQRYRCYGYNEIGEKTFKMVWSVVQIEFIFKLFIVRQNVALTAANDPALWSLLFLELLGPRRVT